MNPGTVEYHRTFIERIDENIAQLQQVREGHAIEIRRIQSDVDQKEQGEGERDDR